MNTLDKILYLVKLRGLSDNEFSTQTGLYKTVLSEWRKEKTQSYVKHLPVIAKVLNVSEDFLIDDSQSFSTNTGIQLNEDLQEILLNAAPLSKESISLLNTFIELLQAKEILNKQTKS